MYMEMNSTYKSHTVGNMRNTYVHGNKQRIYKTIRLGTMDVQVFLIYNEIAYCHQLCIYESFFSGDFSSPYSSTQTNLCPFEVAFRVNFRV
jgi:hypothetical protein